MNHWLLDAIDESRQTALKAADRRQYLTEMGCSPEDVPLGGLPEVAQALELAALDLILDRFTDDPERESSLRRCAADAFRLRRAMPFPESALETGFHLLRSSALAVLGDRGADAARWLRTLEARGEWPALPLETKQWGDRTWATIIDVWLCLIRKQGWVDRDTVLIRIAALRDSQEEFERDYLEAIPPAEAKASALELIGLYHLAKAADILAHFVTDGVVEGNHQVQQMLDTHFDRALAVGESARLVTLEPLTRLLAAAAAQMVNNSIWTVTRAVNSRVTHFVQSLVDRGRGDKALFDVLPPQRRALAERGLLGSSRRAVVVSLPTSSGKTLIAQFRILQALNQFDDQEGWVAYLAPTRTLVNQVTRQLRRDFSIHPLNIVVERVSPAMEIDGVEMDLLNETEAKAKFRVLVTTPEKLDLMLRQGWEAKIGRPLTLVVVDEAHNIQDATRGLRLELLLATINKECLNAQFLLLTPFINNAKEVARWLGGSSSDDISLGLEWQPNDRAIGVVRPVDAGPLSGKSRDYQIEFSTVHTSRQTIAVDEVIAFHRVPEIAPTFSKVKHPGEIAAVAAHHLQKRGPVIVMHRMPDEVWSLAAKLRVEANRFANTPDEVELVQEYIEEELGEGFPLIGLLDHGIGVHHSGLPDEVRVLMEWLFEGEHLRFLVATTTIAQGVNFPVSGVVMASNQYPYGQDMPPEDFWNIAGRAGRISQGQLGVVALAATDEARQKEITKFINNATGDLNSALIGMAQKAGDALSDLGGIVYHSPEWSSFLQYLSHTYLQMGKPSGFANQIEQVLRGTLGFEKLRVKHGALAKKLLAGIDGYSEYLRKPGQPLKLVDSTGFSLQSIVTVLKHKGGIGAASWDEQRLFAGGNDTLQDMMGVLLRVPELRGNLTEVTGGQGPDGDKLALIIKDWVSGASLPELASRYFHKDGEDLTKAMTRCGRSLFSKMTQTVSWGLGALLSITGNELSEADLKRLSNLPSRVFYGVNSDEAITLRLLGVPRSAAEPLARHLRVKVGAPLTEVRGRLHNLETRQWVEAMGERGKLYRRVWMILEGHDD